MTCQLEAYPVSATEATAAVQQLMKNQNIKRAAPFAGKTAPACHIATVDYGQRFEQWFRKLLSEPEFPNQEQIVILHAMADRLLEEVEVLTTGSKCYIEASQKKKKTP